MTRHIETDSLSNQDISSALAIGAYTADADRLILVQWFADQVAGNGDYACYLTHQIAGAGSSYRYIPITEAAAASGLTAIAGQSTMVAVRNGDVLTLYLDGLAGDTSTPDTTVRWFELSAVRLTDAIPDSYAADGAQPTVAQAILMTLQYLMERSVSGTTVTVKKPDGSTAAMTFTLDDADNPTSQTRAS